jgi:predicted Fe-Mo cluster-binding NifX family protein
MKIGIPVMESTTSATNEIIAPGFNHTPLLGIYDMTSNTMEMMNLEKENYYGGFSDFLKDRGIKTVISPFYSPVVLRLFRIMNIITLKASGNDVPENIKALKEGMLPVYTFADALQSAAENCDPSFCGSCGSIC